MLIGDAGTGKTTLVHAALAEEAGANRCIVCVKNPTLNRSEFLEFLTNGFGLKADPGASKSRFLLALERALHERRRAGGLSALIIDEAQALPDELLEEVRLLANLETPTEKLLSVILVGQPELSDRLNDASLRQLKATGGPAEHTTATKPAGNNSIHLCTHPHGRWKESRDFHSRSGDRDLSALRRYSENRLSDL